MEASVLFLISGIITARFLDKSKMRLAAVFHAAMFIIVSSLLLFAVEVDLIRVAFTNLLGEYVYNDIHRALLETMCRPYYGISLMAVACVTSVAQIVFAVLTAARAVAICFVRKAPALRFKKAYPKLASSVRSLFVPKRINLIFCRMLN